MTAAKEVWYTPVGNRWRTVVASGFALNAVFAADVPGGEINRPDMCRPMHAREIQRLDVELDPKLQLLFQAQMDKKKVEE